MHFQANGLEYVRQTLSPSTRRFNLLTANKSTIRHGHGHDL